MAGHPGCRLYCPADEVESHAAKHFGDDANISMMVDAVAACLAWAEVWDSPTGLVVEGINSPKTWAGWTWRNSMPDPTRRRTWERSAAVACLNRWLTPDSLSDLRELLQLYPDHVVEFTALDSNLGTLPGRNAVIWEVRQY